jgi:protein required for attachment to host cells
MKHKTIWALVANGGKARILKDVTGAEQPEEEEFASDQKPLGEIMADRAGRTFSSVGSRRSGKELHSDPVRDREREFATMLAETLDGHATAGRFDELVVVAAPQMLGDLRGAFSKSLRQKVTREVDKDLTQLPGKELAETIGEIARQQRGE